MNLFIRLLGSGFLVQILTIFSTLIFSRIFTIEEFGELAFYVSYGSLIVAFGGMRFDYLILKENINEKYIGYMLSNLISLVVNILIVLIAIFINIKFEILKNINFYYMFLFGVGFCFFNNFVQYLVSEKKYDYFIKLRLIQVVIVFIVVIIFYYIFNFEDSMIYAYSLSQLFLGVICLFLVLDKSKISKLNNFYKFFKSFFRESLKNSIISFLQYGSPLVPVLIGGYFFDQKNIGAYFVFSQMISAPLNIFRRNILIFFNGEFSNKDKFNVFIKSEIFKIKNLIIFTIMILMLSIVMMFFQKEIVYLVLGQQWVSYSYLLLPLIIYFVFDCLLQPFTTLLPLWGKVNYSLSIEAFRFIFLISVLPLLIIYFNFNFVQFLIGYIFIMLFFYLIIFLKVIFLGKNKGFRYI